MTGVQGRIAHQLRKPALGAMPWADCFTATWQLRVIIISKKLNRQIARRRACEAAINAARFAAHLEPFEFDWRPARAGRPEAEGLHPMPRRRPDRTEQFDALTHRTLHKTNFTIGCPRCYAREYQFFLHHEDKRPFGKASAGSRFDPTNPAKPRWQPFITPGWEKHVTTTGEAIPKPRRHREPPRR